MSASVAVQGIVSGGLMGINLPSTADLQRASIERKQQAERVKAEKAQARAERKNEKIFAEIRTDLIQKAFNLSEKEIKKIENTLALFEEDANRDLTDKEKLMDSINVANGARGTEKASRRNFNWLLFGGVSTLAGLGLNYAIGKSVNDILTGAVAKLVGGVLGGPIIGILVVGIELAVKAIYNLHYKRKADRGNRSDTKEKERHAIENIKQTLDKITKFTEEIQKDQAMLIEKKKSMSKKDFDKFLDQYLKGKTEFLKELGVNDYFRGLAEDTGLENNISKAMGPAVALGASA